MWWLIGSAPDIWSRGPWLASGISHNDSDAQQDHCEESIENSGKRGKPSPEAKKGEKKSFFGKV